MNLVSLSNPQLDLLRSTLQKQQSELLGDLNMGNLSDASADLLNERYDLIRDTLNELNDCNTPKVVKPSPLQQTSEPAWEGTTAAAKVIGVAAKTLYNLKSTGKLRKNTHWQKTDRSITWNVAALSNFFSENSH